MITFHRKRRLPALFVYAALFVSVPLLFAHSSGPSRGSSGSDATKENGKKQDSSLEVVADCPPYAYKEKGADGIEQTRELKFGTTQWIQLGQPVTVCLTHLDEWLKTDKNRVSKLRLVLAGYVIPNEPLLRGPEGQEYVNFPLKMNLPSDREVWSNIINATRHSTGRISLTVAEPNQNEDTQVFSSSLFVTFDLYPQRRIVIVLVTCIGLAALIVLLGAKSGLLRDNTSGNTGRAPFSLARTQMAWWLFLVVCSYVYLWVITAQTQPITAQVLSLLGISAATGLAAVLADANQQSNVQGLKDEESVLQARIAQISSASPPAGSDLFKELQEKTNRLLQVQAQLLTATKTSSGPGGLRGFVLDLLSEKDAVSFHRFQIVVWTVVLGVIFGTYVYSSLSMPVLDSSLLVLLGISGGTYVGFKFPEK